ncbi:uncharacterized protein ACBR49_000796 [Aulostomus maculatus]
MDHKEMSETKGFVSLMTEQTEEVARSLGYVIETLERTGSVLFWWNMMLLCWCALLLSLASNAENTTMRGRCAENITLECSAAGCPKSIQGCVGMYLYQVFKERKEVLYYHPKASSKDKITPAVRYINRIQTIGSLQNHTITISNLTQEDSGLYSCVYVWFPMAEVQCNVYIIVVEGAPPRQTQVTPTEKPVKRHCPAVFLAVIITCVVSILATVVLALLIIHGAKLYAHNRRTKEDSNDGVYEEMTRKGVQHLQITQRQH